MKHKLISKLSGGNEHTNNRKDIIKATMLRTDIDLHMKMFYIEAYWAMSLVMRGIDTTKANQKMVENTIIAAI